MKRKKPIYFAASFSCCQQHHRMLSLVFSRRVVSLLVLPPPLSRPLYVKRPIDDAMAIIKRNPEEEV
jgi:hypothetical protein